MTDLASNTSKATEEAKPATGEQNQNLIPKDEFERVTKEKDANIQTLQKTVEDLQSKLLDDTYLEFISSKKSGIKETTASLAGAGVPQEVIAEINSLKANSAQLQQTLQNVVYHLELAECEKAHPDFNTYRSDIQKILEAPDGNYTFEQAYKLAKANKISAEISKQESKENPKPQATEKPSPRVPATENTVKEFKTLKEANAATIESLKAKYGLSGDTL